MQRHLLAVASVLASCGTAPPEYCSGTTDTRHLGTWEIAYTETEGDCGHLGEPTIVYPTPTPPRDEDERKAYMETYFGRVRHKAFLQADCSYEGSHHYETSGPPESVRESGEPWPAPSTQVSDVLSVGDGEIAGTLDLSIENDYRGIGACSSRYDVALVRVE